MTTPAEETNTPPISVDELLGRVTSAAYRITKTVPILVAPQALIDEHAELDVAFREAAINDVAIGDNTSTVIVERLEAVEQELEAFYVPFKVGAIAKRAWADLLKAHPPTKAQLAEDNRCEFNPDTFPAMAIAACLISPVMSFEQVKILEDGVENEDGESTGGLNDAQFNTLFNNVAAVNMSGLAAPKSVAVGVLHRANAASSPPPTTIESLDRSSLDG